MVKTIIAGMVDSETQSFSTLDVGSMGIVSADVMGRQVMEFANVMRSTGGWG